MSRIKRPTVGTYRTVITTSLSLLLQHAMARPTQTLQHAARKSVDITIMQAFSAQRLMLQLNSDAPSPRAFPIEMLVSRHSNRPSRWCTPAHIYGFCVVVTSGATYSPADARSNINN
jgi:hypothetical protein